MNLTTTSVTTSVPASGVMPIATRPAHSDIAGAAGAASEPRANPSPSAVAPAGRFTTIADLAVPDPQRSSASALVPAGTDPDLWRALSPDERAFFAHTPRSESPVYYRRAAASSSASAPPQLRRGLHLDLRA